VFQKEWPPMLTTAHTPKVKNRDWSNEHLCE